MKKLVWRFINYLSDIFVLFLIWVLDIIEKAIDLYDSVVYKIKVMYYTLKNKPKFKKGDLVITTVNPILIAEVRSLVVGNPYEYICKIRLHDDTNHNYFLSLEENEIKDAPQMFKDLLQ